VRVCCVVSQFKCFVKENQSKMKKSDRYRAQNYDRLILFDDLSCIALNKEMVKKMVSLINYSSKLVLLS
jgi:hypothetical protein